ncbi:MAG: hypothetical protein RIR11_1757 [Bacteroidota bacterium]|jgi:hypothetical protein
MKIIYCDSGFSPKEVDYMYVSPKEKVYDDKIPNIKLPKY